MTIHAEYPTPKGERMNAIDELNRLLEETGLSPEDGKVASDIIDRIEREWMERPIGSDKVPIKIGDEVCCEERYTHVGGEDVVQATGKVEELVLSGKGWEVYVDSYDDSFPTSCIHHTKPGSWEQIEADACKNYMNYFGCSGFACADCPSKINGAKPYNRYDTDSCELAMRLDIVRRCKALSERGA